MCLVKRKISMDSDTSRTTGGMILLLSLLLHILILLLIFLFQTASHDAQNMQYIDLENQVPLDPLQQQQFPQSQQQSPQTQQQMDPYDPDHEIMIELIAQGMNPNDTLTEEAGEIVRDTATPIPGALPQESAAAEDEDANNTTDSDDESAMQDEMPAQEMSEQPSEIPAPAADERPSDDLSKGAQAFDPFNDSLAAQLPPPSPITAKPAAPKQAIKKVVRKMAQRPPLTPAQAQALSKLAQGFMQSMNAELGGKPSNDPTQLAHQRYMTKLWNNLKQTVNAENNSLSLANDLDTQATLVLTINKQGKLINAILRHPRKTNDILQMESMLISNAQRVGLFPPLPESFKKEEVTFVMPIHLRALQGIHSGYRLQVEQ
jgi:hypothetical protein